MKQLHNKLLQRSRHYRRWHEHPLHKHVHWGLLAAVVLGVALSFVLLGWSEKEVANVQVARAQSSSCTHYASPTGGGNGATQGSPFQIADFWSVASPGKTLCLLNGTYRGDRSMIDPPDNLNGAAGSPITVRALNDGKVTIDGEDARWPARLRFNNYFILEGFNAHSSPYEVVELARGANNNIVRRVVAWDARSDGNAMVFASNFGSDNLFEDVAGWGSGRKIFAVFEDTRTTFRRCFFRWTYHTDTKSFWKVAATLSYRSRETLIENCIGTWDDLPGTFTEQRHAIFGIDTGSPNSNHRILGTIGYLLSEQIAGTGGPDFIFSTVNFPADFTIKDVIGYTDVPHGGVSVFALDSKASFNASHLTSIGSHGFTDDYIPWSFWTVNNYVEPVNHIIVQDAGRFGTNDGSKFDYVLYWNNAKNFEGSAPAHYIVADPQLTANGGNILQYGLSEEERPKINGQPVGAQIQYRYVNGELTNEPLWPWPMNERIKEAMVQSGYDKKGGLDGKGGTDLMKTVFELGGGTMPPDFGGGGGPICGQNGCEVGETPQSCPQDCGTTNQPPRNLRLRYLGPTP